MSKFTVLAFVIGAILGALALYLLLQWRVDSVPAGWRDLVMEYGGPGFSTEAFEADIPLNPPTTSGNVEFSIEITYWSLFDQRCRSECTVNPGRLEKIGPLTFIAPRVVD